MAGRSGSNPYRKKAQNLSLPFQWQKKNNGRAGLNSLSMRGVVMREIARQVYIEDQYPGVVLGAISLPHGLIQIDAPPSPEDGRSWRASLLNLNSGVERILVNLDAHPDRT